jgi:sigma-B regulation protein RsbU (phosphoserine phosphatase)
VRTYVSVKFPLLDAKGAVTAVAGISTDITEQLRAQKLEDELLLGSAFQQKLFPKAAPLLLGLEIAGAARPVAKLCGDYYDFIVRGRERIVLAVGDVSGHGTGPALAMMEVRAILRGLLSQQTNVDLPQVLQELNRLLAADLPEGAFVSLFLAKIDMAQRSIRYAGAGHEAMLIRAGQRVMNIDSTGPVLGLFDDVKFVDVPPLAVREGDVLFICTDGVTEAMNPHFDMYGRQRLTDYLAKSSWKSPSEIIQSLFTEVVEFSSGQPISDDMTAVVAKIGDQQVA